MKTLKKSERTIQCCSYELKIVEELREDSKGEFKQVVTCYKDGKKTDIKHYPAYMYNGELSVSEEATYTRYFY